MVDCWRFEEKQAKIDGEKLKRSQPRGLTAKIRHQRPTRKRINSQASHIVPQVSKIGQKGQENSPEDNESSSVSTKLMRQWENHVMHCKPHIAAARKRSIPDLQRGYNGTKQQQKTMSTTEKLFKNSENLKSKLQNNQGQQNQKKGQERKKKNRRIVLLKK